MQRRHFIQTGLAAGAGLTLASPAVFAATHRKAGEAKFKLDYAPHFGMFTHHAGEDLVEQLRFMAAQGFRAFEDNEMRQRPVDVQTALGEELARLDMRMGVFVAHTIAWTEPNLARGEAGARDHFLEEIRASVEVAKRVGATWMTVVPGALDPRLEMEYQTANVVETLKRAAAILEPHGLVMVLEPLNPWRDHPGLFLARSPHAYLICKAVDSPACKILFDIYHQQITEGNLIPNIERSWDEIAYFQIGDNPGRNEPGTGEINYRNVFAFIHGKGFDGILGMEHGNATPGRPGEQAVIDAYLAADSF